jgi:hypothetical protein
MTQGGAGLVPDDECEADVLVVMLGALPLGASMLDPYRLRCREDGLVEPNKLKRAVDGEEEVVTVLGAACAERAGSESAFWARRCRKAGTPNECIEKACVLRLSRKRISNKEIHEYLRPTPCLRRVRDDSDSMNDRLIRVVRGSAGSDDDSELLMSASDIASETTDLAGLCTLLRSLRVEEGDQSG